MSRDIVIRCRVSSEEYEILEQKAMASGLKLSAYIRASGLGLEIKPKPIGRPKPIVPEVNRKLYFELNKIGVNLNQAVKELYGLRISMPESKLSKQLLERIIDFDLRVTRIVNQMDAIKRALSGVK